MLIEKEEKFEQKIYKLELKNNNNILSFIFDFCDLVDILNLSVANKRFNNIIKESFDYKFEEEIEKNYFSDYSNYE
jgi:hypothetical protein